MYNIITVNENNTFSDYRKERSINMSRKYVPISKVPTVMGYNNWNELNTYCVDLWENMGFCKDGISRWYHFTSDNGEPCYTIKH